MTFGTFSQTRIQVIFLGGLLQCLKSSCLREVLSLPHLATDQKQVTLMFFFHSKGILKKPR